MASKRLVKESPLNLGEIDERTPQVNFAAIGTPSAPVVMLIDLNTATDVSSTKLSGVASVSTTYVICPKIVDLVAGHEYLLIVGCTIGSDKPSAICVIKGEK